jgi:hypothetical protein
VPRGDKRLTVAPVATAGVVRVVSRGPSGKVIADERVEVDPGRGSVLEVPAGAQLVSVSTNGVEVSGTVLASGDGDAVLRLRPVQRSGLVADVLPGLPSS